MSNQFNFEKFSLRWIRSLNAKTLNSWNHSWVLFDPKIESYLTLRLWAWLDLGAIAMNRWPAFSKAPGLLKPHHQIVWCHNQDTRCGDHNLLQRCSRCIIHSQPTGQPGFWLVRVINPLYKQLLCFLLKKTWMNSFRGFYVFFYPSHQEFLLFAIIPIPFLIFLLILCGFEFHLRQHWAAWNQQIRLKFQFI